MSPPITNPPARLTSKYEHHQRGFFHGLNTEKSKDISRRWRSRRTETSARFMAKECECR